MVGRRSGGGRGRRPLAPRLRPRRPRPRPPRRRRRRRRAPPAARRRRRRRLALRPRVRSVIT